MELASEEAATTGWVARTAATPAVATAGTGGTGDVLLQSKAGMAEPAAAEVAVAAASKATTDWTIAGFVALRTADGAEAAAAVVIAPTQTPGNGTGVGGHC